MIKANIARRRNRSAKEDGYGNALISIRGKQYSPDFDGSEQIEIITTGQYTKRGDMYTISYDESELTGTEGTQTTILVEPGNRVTLTRIGCSSASMVFEQGKRNSGLYHVDEHPMTLTVDAFKVVNRLTDEGGTLFVDYQIELNSQFMSKNNILIKIRGGVEQ